MPLFVHAPCCHAVCTAMGVPEAMPALHAAEAHIERLVAALSAAESATAAAVAKSVEAERAQGSGNSDAAQRLKRAEAELAAATRALAKEKEAAAAASAKFSENQVCVSSGHYRVIAHQDAHSSLTRPCFESTCLRADEAGADQL